MNFKSIIGHQRQLKSLEADLENENLAQGYLFAGPAGIGKFTIAKAFARGIQTFDLNEDEAFALGNQIDRNIHLDTMIFPHLPGEESIKIADVRSITSNLQMTGQSRKRVLIMENIERMTAESANAMLKIMEEPPSKVVFIFTTEHPALLLETVLSRLRRVDFGLLDQEELKRGLTNRFRLSDALTISKVSDLAIGRIGKAIKLMENPEMLASYDNVFTEIRRFIGDKKITEAFGFIAQIHGDTVLTQIFLEISSLALREEMLKGLRFGDIGKAEWARMALEKLLKVKEMSETNVNNRLLLENLILSL